MKLTESMLRDFVQTDLSVPELADLLTMVGFEEEETLDVEGEAVMDINIMANRGDGASVLGLSREILAKDQNAKPTDLYQRLSQKDRGETSASWCHISIQSENCSRFCARVIENIENGESPSWLKDRLRRVGQKPISLLVDLSNYVMFETGQPLHAYDLDKLSDQKIIVRQALPGEQITTLDGTECRLDPSMLMICDGKGPIGVAGVMGGESTEVSAGTKRCLVEAAHFSNISVRATRKALGLFTEASYRFERWVDPDLPMTAVNRFVELYEQITGRSGDKSSIDIYHESSPPAPILVRIEKACARLGMDVSLEEAISYCQALGMEIAGHDDKSLSILPPSWRIDLVREEDVIEEIGRIHGYEKIPSISPSGSTPLGGVHGFEAMQDDVRKSLLLSGFDQMIGHTMRSLHTLDRLGDRVKVRTPHSPEIENLRNSLLPNLSDFALRNGGKDLHLFEMGRVFETGSETIQLALLSVGQFERNEWQKGDESQANFFSLKGVLESIGQTLHAPLSVSPSEDPRLHRTRQAAVAFGGYKCGVFGQIHPIHAEQAGLEPSTVLAEINLSALENLAGTLPHYKPVSRMPGIRRDLAILISKDVPFSQIEKAIRSSSQYLESFWLFDVYEGKGIEDGFHSLALAFVFRKAESTFTDEQANQERDQIVAGLAQIGAKVR